MKRVYLAGPMTGLPDFNFPAFHAAAADLRVDGGADTTVYVGEPILPHGVSLQVRCKLTETAAMTVWLVTLAREIDGKLTLRPEEMPQADHVPAGALDVPEDEYDESQRRHGRPFIGFQL